MQKHTHIIITGSGHKHPITSAQHATLTLVGLDDIFDLGNGIQVKGSAIMEVLPIEEYYEQHPAERPQPVQQSPNFDTVDSMDRGYSGIFELMSADERSNKIVRRAIEIWKKQDQETKAQGRVSTLYKLIEHAENILRSRGVSVG